MMQAILFTLSCILISCIGLFLFRKISGEENLKRSNESTGIYIGVITILYSLVLAFVVTSIWNDYEENNTNIEAEAQKLADIYSYSNEFPANHKNSGKNSCQKLYRNHYSGF